MNRQDKVIFNEHCSSDINSFTDLKKTIDDTYKRIEMLDGVDLYWPHVKKELRVLLSELVKAGQTYQREIKKHFDDAKY